MDLVERALVFAFNAHDGQKRKYTGAPYIVHPISVMAILVEHNVEDSAMLAAALLHDVIEDCGVLIGTLEAKFGVLVASLVQDLTDEFTKESYPELNRAERKRLERNRLGEGSVPAKQIKLADMIDNSRGLDASDKFTDVYMQEKAALIPLLSGQGSYALGGDTDSHTALMETARQALLELRERRESTKS